MLCQTIYQAPLPGKAIKRELVVVDIVLGCYQVSSIEAFWPSIRTLKEAGAHAVKLEVGDKAKDSVLRILCARVSVVGHQCLTQQSVDKFKTYTVHVLEKKLTN